MKHWDENHKLSTTSPGAIMLETIPAELFDQVRSYPHNIFAGMFKECRNVDGTVVDPEYVMPPIDCSICHPAE